MKTVADLKQEIKLIQEELESRYKTGKIKTATDGTYISTKDLQEKMYKLAYELSKILSSE